MSRFERRPGWYISRLVTVIGRHCYLATSPSGLKCMNEMNELPRQHWSPGPVIKGGSSHVTNAISDRGHSLLIVYVPKSKTARLPYRSLEKIEVNPTTLHPYTYCIKILRDMLEISTGACCRRSRRQISRHEAELIFLIWTPDI